MGKKHRKKKQSQKQTSTPSSQNDDRPSDTMTNARDVRVSGSNTIGGSNHEMNVESIQSRSNKENAAVQYSLGVCHFEGKGVPQDMQKAAKHFKLALIKGMLMRNTILEFTMLKVKVYLKM